MKFVAYLSFDGRCREAFEYYAEVLGGTITGMTTFGEMPDEQDLPPGWEDKIINAHLVVGDQELMGCDPPPEMFNGVEGASMSIQLDDQAEAERIFNTLADGGSITMPLSETSWARRFGMTRDRYGVHWMVNCGSKS